MKYSIVIRLSNVVQLWYHYIMEHPHRPEPRRSLDAPSNITARLYTREFGSRYGGIHINRRDRQFVYSRFRQCRTYRRGSLTCITFLGDSSRIAAGSHSGELKIFDSSSNNVVESCAGHRGPLTVVQSNYSSGAGLILSSSAHDVRLWDASSVSAGPIYSFDGCKTARFSNSGTKFAALSTESSQEEGIMLYDVETCQLDLSFNTSSVRGPVYSVVHFNPSDTMLLWNGVLWDKRSSDPIHHFDQFKEYGGGGFHPAGNEVIINSEVWDIRSMFRRLQTVDSLDKTVIKFNASGDVIYAILSRYHGEYTLEFYARRYGLPIFNAFRTVDAINYSDIATIPVDDDRVLDLATEPTDSFVGLVSMDERKNSSARVYKIGRRRPTDDDDDSDPDDADSEEEEDEEEEDDDPRNFLGW